MSFSEEELTHLKQQETELRPQYVVDGSTLEEINDYFPKLQGRNFYSWLEYSCKTGNGQIMEIGGGLAQQAAWDILNGFPIRKYIAVEKRKIDFQRRSLERLKRFESYKCIESGISDIPDHLSGQKYSVIFANSVAEHLPQPLALLRVCYPLLDENGVMFFNGIPVTEEWIKNAEGKAEPGKLSIYRERTEKEILDRGLVNIAIAIQKGEVYPEYINE